MKSFRFNLPKILLFAWDRHRLDEIGFSYALHHLPAALVVVSPSKVPAAIQQMARPAVIACLFVVSREAFTDSTFPESVRACLNQLSARKEFRLFVHLDGITKHDLLAFANSIPAAADLLDSVHIGESSEEEEYEQLVEHIEKHLQQLPEILDYLKYETWKHMAVGLSPLLNIAFLVTIGYGCWRLAVHREETLESIWLPWILATIGACCYLSFLAVCSFGSTLRSGNVFRWGMAIFPLWIINFIPSSKLLANWQFLLAGFGAGILLDSSRRMWAMMRRMKIPIVPSQETSASQKVTHSGGRQWQMLTTAPVLEVEPRVFISYSRASQWGSATAASLHTAIKAAGVASWLDADGIAEGISWRHKLQEAIGKSNVFIAVQDSLTASRHWPCAELNAAMQSQAYCGLPSVIIVRDSTLMKHTENKSDLLDGLLYQEGEVDPTLLRIIDFKPDTIRNLALGLVNFSPACVMNPTVSTIINTFIGPMKVALAAIGSIGPGLVIAVFFIGCVLRLFGLKIEDWIFAQSVGPACMIGVGFFLGFTMRLVFASRFELRLKDAPIVFWSHLWATLVLFWAGKSLVSHVAPLTIFVAILLAGFGFLLACDFVSKSLPGSGNYHPPPV
jgi:hypothetical protein